MAGFNLGDVIVQLKADSTNFTNGVNKSKDSLNSLNDNVGKAHKGFVAFAAIMGAVAGVAQAVVTKAINFVSSAIDGAIKRVDTLENADRTFQNMGFSAKDTKSAMDDLNKSILGLPISLDDAVRGTTALAASYQDVKLGQKVFSALNNAILGFGGSADMVTNAVMQLSQLPLDGPLDAQTWNSLRNSGITPVLVAMSKDMHTTVGQLKSDFGDGTLKVSDFTKELVKLNTKGGGGLKSLTKIAQDSTAGIGTGLANAKTAITRGLANIIQAVGSANISKLISMVGHISEVGLKKVASFIDYLKQHKQVFINFAKSVQRAFEDLKKALTPLFNRLREVFNRFTEIHLFTKLPASIQAVLSPLGFLILHFKEVWRVIKQLADIFMTRFWPSIKALAQTIWTQFWPSLKSLWDSLMRLWRALNPALMTALKVIGIIIGGVLIAAIWVLVKVLDVAFKALGLIAKVIAIVIGWIANLIGWIGTAAIKVYRALQTIHKAFEAIKKAAINSVITVAEWFASLPGRILRAIGRLARLLYNAGADLLRGLIKGVKSQVGAVVDTVKNAVSGAVNAVKGFLGIHSPSTVFAEMGRNMAEGMVIGIKSGAPNVMHASTALAKSGTNGAAVTNNQTTSINGPIHIGSQTDADYFFRRIDRNQKLTNMGLSSANG